MTVRSPAASLGPQPLNCMLRAYSDVEHACQPHESTGPFIIITPPSWTLSSRSVALATCARVGDEGRFAARLAPLAGLTLEGKYM